MLKRIVLICCILTILPSVLIAQERTVVRDKKAKQMLMGRHRISLQWISWDYFGAARVTERKGIVYLKGRQDQRKSTNFVAVDGVITEIDAKQFTIDGTVTTQVDQINDGKQCERKGILNFRITGSRKYWRLQQMDNPCDQATDYVDIFFR